MNIQLTGESPFHKAATPSEFTTPTNTVLIFPLTLYGNNCVNATCNESEYKCSYMMN